MKKYIFYNTDESGREEYDIREEAYKILIRTCCRYSTVFYVKFTYPNLPGVDILKKFEIEKPDYIPADTNIHGVSFAIGQCYCEQRYYRVCPELCDVLMQMAGGIFEWLCGWGFRNPDDPTFYREDGSVFFSSEIHEGVCGFSPQPEEDVEELLRSVKWLTGKDVWDLPPGLRGPNYKAYRSYFGEMQPGLEE